MDKDTSRLWRWGLRFRGAKLCQDLDGLPRETQAALVAVPNALHAPIVVELLKRGIHVLCEKPMATTIEECQRMVQAAHDRGTVLMIGHHKRFVPSIHKAKELLEEGRLGRIHTVNGSMGLPRTWRSRTDFYQDRALAGGGVLMDNGVHLIDLVLWLVGEMEELHCYTLPKGSPLEEEAKLEFRLQGDAAGMLRVSHQRVLPNVFRIEGEAGFLEFDTYDHPSLKVFSRSAQLCQNFGCITLQWAKTSPYQNQLSHFVQFLQGVEPNLMNSGEEALPTIQVIARAYNQVGDFEDLAGDLPTLAL
jgi:predicted dehydrogenase